MYFGCFFCGCCECNRVAKLFDTVAIWVYEKISNKNTAWVSLSFEVHVGRHP